MTTTVGLLVAEVVVVSMGTAASLDQLVKQLRARHRIGVVAYSAYSRAADFHTGVPYYAPIIGGWLVFIPAAAFTGLSSGAAGQIAYALTATLIGLGAHIVVTGLRAAPILLSQRSIALDDEAKLAALFDRFSHWHRLRTLIDAATLAAAVWALIAALR